MTFGQLTLNSIRGSEHYDQFYSSFYARKTWKNFLSERNKKTLEECGGAVLIRRIQLGQLGPEPFSVQCSLQFRILQRNTTVFRILFSQGDDEMQVHILHQPFCRCGVRVPSPTFFFSCSNAWVKQRVAKKKIIMCEWREAKKREINRH